MSKKGQMLREKNPLWKGGVTVDMKKYQKDYHLKNKESSRDKRLKYKYGITLEEYKELSQGQGGICKICKKQEKLYVDHNHITSKVRGLLCHKCNVGIGYFEDSVDFLENAIKYLSTT
jgi:hypothetical protein